MISLVWQRYEVLNENRTHYYNTRGTQKKKKKKKNLRIG